MADCGTECWATPPPPTPGYARLKAGVPTNMPIYLNWLDCWSHLSAIGQLKRGSSLLWRYYSGPYMSSTIESSGRRVHAQAFKYSLQ
ncbi:mitochondrial carrier 2 [Trichonephila clavipes]|nr:mitochondrial carrier 2 [Trichonephila clavipes]